MSNDNQSGKNRPDAEAFHVREGVGDDAKSYFNRIGAVWDHKDGEGSTVQLDTIPLDGKIVIRKIKDRIQETKENARDGQNGDRRDDRRDDKRGSNRDDRSQRDGGPRYER